jgi:Glycerol-3-phosphate O-acyltransferase
MVNAVLASPAVRAAVKHEGLRSGQTSQRVEARARRIAREIAADYSTTAIRVMELVLNWLWRRMFTGVEVRGIEKLRDATLGCGVIYMPSHRSHTDYLLLSYVLYQAGLVPPHVAAGANLDFWPVGGLLRRCGAFFMRRRFGGDGLYTTVFRAYVEALIQRGYPISFYPEGGRSRSGRLLPARTGLLTMAVEAGLRSRAVRWRWCRSSSPTIVCRTVELPA